jgi:hypothetical protein
MHLHGLTTWVLQSTQLLLTLLCTEPATPNGWQHNDCVSCHFPHRGVGQRRALQIDNQKLGLQSCPDSIWHGCDLHQCMHFASEGIGTR